ncbi:hypothetical protein NQ315_011432 [Exocentrus adspersus]|uniref:Centrosome-associated zinc finger protein CP190 n=1 Tax=Exocentrus adspersus TaxID=1586481 RepID=A0AAV8VUT7_9CUCU|nr:hypothetical protein NQ315_011432 [Exocentrus adspersus]
MGENKQVRVDNWGTFFLQRLQLFFSKTDYCDLTLQFQGNVQLKVHRLVVCACTEYFNFLEETCQTLEENTILMPPDLQADVILPIVNFMYTGMLEFQTSIFEQLYRAAEVMNISVLTKLLDAQRAHLNYKSQKKKPELPHPNWNAQPPKPRVQKPPELPPTLPGRKLPVWTRKKAPMQHPTSQLQFSEQKYPQDPLLVPDNTPKPTRFEWPDDDLPQISMMDTSFEDISYTSKPLLKEEEVRASTSFDDARRNDCANNEENIDELEGNEYSNQKRKLDGASEKSSPKRVKLNDKENKEATISVKGSSNGADLDHTKIVTEILKKYPQLVKKNKNIRLKIMSSGNKNIVEQTVPVKLSKIKAQAEVPKAKVVKALPKQRIDKHPLTEEGPWVCDKCDEDSAQEFVLYYLYRKHMTDVHHESFDPQLCKYCGQWCGKHRLMLYHLYTKHGLKPPASYDFPICDQCPFIALSKQKLLQHKQYHDPEEMQCVSCRLAFTSQQTLNTHIQITGHVTREGTNKHDCQYCTKRLQSTLNLFTHIKNSHLKEAKRDGIVILDEMEEDSDDEVEEEEVVVQKDKVKIISNVKVSSRTEQNNSPVQHVPPLEPSSEAEALSNVASGIATSLGLVDIVVLNDNQQYILQEDDHTNQPEFIIPDLTTNENHYTGQVITTQHNTVLPQGMLQTTEADIGSTDELVMVLTDHDYQDEQEGATVDNSNIVVLYSHPVDGQQNQFITSQGNLLVNSQTGMLEIRNEPITTTAGGQMIVTSSADAAESIESIQREIDNHRELKQEPYYEDEQKSKVIQVEEIGAQQHEEEAEEEQAEVAQVDQEEIAETTPLEGYQEQEAPGEEKQVDQTKDAEEEEEYQEETEVVEVEEDPSKEPSQDAVDEGCVAGDEPMETEDVEPEGIGEKQLNDQAPSQESVPAEQDSDEVHELALADTSGENEGIDVPSTQKSDCTEINSLPEDPEVFVLNDPNQIESTHAETEGNCLQENSPEAMEVDGKVSDSQQQATEEEHVDEAVPEQNETMQSAEGDCQGADEQQNEEVESELSNHQPVQEESQQQSEPDNSQYNEVEDENSQSSQGTSKNQGNINQTILEDWDDTDSQQSDKQRSVTKAAEAAENVNKLMDDWEEEDDDDDKKEGD